LPPSEFERGKGGKGMKVGRSIACPLKGSEMGVKYIKILLTAVTQAPNTKGRLKGEKYQSGKVALLGICTGSPGVFLGHPCPYPRKTVPGRSGAGNYGHGHGVHSGSRVPEGISGYRILSHVGVQL
jgi:hypothetical protein